VKIEYPNLDLLRAVAVTLVFVCHILAFMGVSSFPYGNWGDFGVCIFFVHTSLVLIQSIAHQEPGPLFMPFMIRRGFRIYPLAIVVLSTVVLFKIPQAAIAPGHFTTWNYDWIDVLVNLALVQGLTSGGRAESIIGPFWSLTYEMQMYTLLPLLFVLVNRKRRAVALAVMYLSVLLVSLAICRYFPLTTIFTFAPCFAAGIVSYFLLQAQQPRLPSYLWPVLLAVMSAGSLFVRLDGSNSHWWTFCGVIGLSIPLFGQISYKPLVATAKTIARYSYGIYVTHCLCIWLTLGKMPGPVILRILACIILTGFVSVALYHFIEEPFIRAGKRVAALYVKERIVNVGGAGAVVEPGGS
jgi:peptidoglycan/LPS O-acetylase OafA/YrhL